MILSFHTCFEADKNIICAGRLPNQFDLVAIKEAKAVILPQGCTEALYQMVSANCDNVFPNFSARFLYPGKIGQAKLFELKQISYPKSWTYNSLNDFMLAKKTTSQLAEHDFPFVFKFDWGGEGETVFLVETEKMFSELLSKVAAFEKSGDFGFLIQEYIESPPRTLRVVVVGKKNIAYWRVQSNKKTFGEHLSSGSHIEKNIDSVSTREGIGLVQKFCVETGINLAGFDLIFSDDGITPFLLEVNYFFGRRGLGGSERYYKLLNVEIQNWIISLGLLIPRIKL